MTSTSVRLYEGPSLITGDPIVAVATNLRRRSMNPKTGNAVQVWFVVKDSHPTEALRTGADRAVCGDCPHRGRGVQLRQHGRFAGWQRTRSCYVNPLSVVSVWRAAQRWPLVGPEACAPLLEGRTLRVGAYGDPVAVPIAYVDAWTKAARYHTGYTHQWRTCDPAWSRILMASTDTPEETREAQARGWRTFRIQTAPVTIKGEVVCPASAERGHRTTCQACHLCDGRRADDHRKGVAILMHGNGRKWIAHNLGGGVYA
jgi:hypothetical protein